MGITLKHKKAVKNFNKELNKLGKEPFFGNGSDKAWKMVKDFMSEYAGVALSDLGYTPNERQINYLMNQKWFTSPYAYLYGRPSYIK